MTNIIKNKKKSSEKKHVKDIKIFLKKKKKKGEKSPKTYQNNFEEQKQNLLEYMRN